MTGGDANLRKGTSGRRAFVVDDDSLSRQLIAAHVERFGFESVEVLPDRSEIEIAVESAGRDDVMILDIILGPELDGVEVIRMLGQGAFAGRLVVVSGFGQEYLQTLNSLAIALSIRVTGALAKPIQPAELERCLTG